MFATGRGFVKTKTPTKTMQNSDTFSDDRVSRRTRLSLSAPRGPTSMAAQRLPAEDDRQAPAFMVAGRMSEDLQDAAQQHLHDASGQDPQRSSIFFQDGSRARAAQQTPQHHTPFTSPALQLGDSVHGTGAVQQDHARPSDAAFPYHSAPSPKSISGMARSSPFGAGSLMSRSASGPGSGKGFGRGHLSEGRPPSFSHVSQHSDGANIGRGASSFRSQSPYRPSSSPLQSSSQGEMNVGHPRQDRRGAALNAQFQSLSSSVPATKWASVSGVNNVLQANANPNPSSNPDGVHGNGSFSTEPGLRQLSPLYDASKPPTQGYKAPAIPYAEDPSGAQHVQNEARSERWLQEQETAALVADRNEAIRHQRQALQDHRDLALASLEAERVSMQAEIDAKMAVNVKLSSELWSASVPPKSANSPLSPSAQHSSDGDNTPARVSPMPPPPAGDASPGASDGGAGVLPTADASGTINVAELVADLDFDYFFSH